MYRRLRQDFGRFRGAYAADAARKNDRMIAREIARVRGNRVRVTERLDYDSLGRILIDAEQVDTADIHDDTWDTFQNADLVLKVRERNRANTEFYIAVEASYTGNGDDFKRAVGHAKMIERVKGVDAYAVVAGARVGQDIESFIRLHPEGFVRMKDADAALWYQIETTDMEPPDPC